MPRRRTKLPDGTKVEPVEPESPVSATQNEVMDAVDNAPEVYSDKDPNQPYGYSRRPQSLIRTERRLQAYRLRREGHKFDEIAAIMECRRQTAFKLVQDAIHDLSDLLNQDIKAVYKGEWMKLDMMEDALWPRVMEGSVEAIDRVLKIQAQRARMFGLNAPEGVYHHHQGSIDINLTYKSDQDL